jgi:hypothetical protein
MTPLNNGSRNLPEIMTGRLGMQRRGLFPVQEQADDHDQVPGDDCCVEDVHDPQAFADSHRDRHCDELADEHAPQPSELNREARDQRIHLECAKMKRHQGREQIQHLQSHKRPTRTQDALEDLPLRIRRCARKRFAGERGHRF